MEWDRLTVAAAERKEEGGRSESGGVEWGRLTVAAAERKEEGGRRKE